MLTLSSKPVGDLTLLFCGVRERNARTFLLHVQHNYFPSLTNDILALRSCRIRSNRLCFNCLVMLLAGKAVIGALSLFDCSVGQSSISRFYYMTSSVSGQDEPNRAL